MFQTNVVKKIKAPFVVNLFFSEIESVWDNVEKYGKSDRLHMMIYYGAENMRFSYRISKARYTDTFMIFYIYCFYKATIVPRYYVISSLPVLLCFVWNAEKQWWFLYKALTYSFL